MAETDKKVLFIFDANKEWARLLRRFVMVFIFGGLSYAVKDYIPLAPEYAIPLITAILAFLDKLIRK